jgi:hypothetical protein
MQFISPDSAIIIDVQVPTSVGTCNNLTDSCSISWLLDGTPQTRTYKRNDRMILGLQAKSVPAERCLSALEEFVQSNWIYTVYVCINALLNLEDPK